MSADHRDGIGINPTVSQTKALPYIVLVKRTRQGCHSGEVCITADAEKQTQLLTSVRISTLKKQLLSFNQPNSNKGVL